MPCLYTLVFAWFIHKNEHARMSFTVIIRVPPCLQVGISSHGSLRHAQIIPTFTHICPLLINRGSPSPIECTLCCPTFEKNVRLNWGRQASWYRPLSIMVQAKLYTGARLPATPSQRLALLRPTVHAHEPANYWTLPDLPCTGTLQF